MPYNFKELKDNVGVLVQRSGDTDYLTQIGVWLNLAQIYLADIYDYWHELKGVHNFTTVDGTATYFMPKDFEKPFRAYDITNDVKLTIKVEEEYFDSNIGNVADATEGDARHIYFTEVVGVKRQVAAAGSTVQAKSSSSSDTAEVVRVEGYVDSDNTIVDQEEITVTGTTNVAGTKTFYKILQVSKDSDSAGYITLSDSSNNTLAVLDRQDRILRHKVARLGLIPDDSTTSMRILYKKKVRKMVDDYDYPFVECDGFLIYHVAALALQQEKEQDFRAQRFMGMAKEELANILTREQSKLGPDHTSRMGLAYIQSHRS